MQSTGNVWAPILTVRQVERTIPLANFKNGPEPLQNSIWRTMHRDNGCLLPKCGVLCVS